LKYKRFDYAISGRDERRSRGRKLALLDARAGKSFSHQPTRILQAVDCSSLHGGQLKHQGKLSLNQHGKAPATMQ